MEKRNVITVDELVQLSLNNPYELNILVTDDKKMARIFRMAHINTEIIQGNRLNSEKEFLRVFAPLVVNGFDGGIFVDSELKMSQQLRDGLMSQGYGVVDLQNTKYGRV